MKSEVRFLKPEENYRFQMVQAVAFEVPYDYEEEKRKSMEAEPEENVYKVGAFSEDGSELYGCLLYNKYRCQFDGAAAELGGIGGVASMPQYRRSGSIRACMNFSLREMYNDGFAFSYLYPFSTEYYRKFGFGPGEAICEWRLPVKGLRTRDTGGSIEQILPGDDMSPLLEVYRKFYSGYNLSVIRDIYSKKLAEENFLAQKRYVYLYRNPKGEPAGFFIFHKETDGNGTVMDCRTSFAHRNDFLFVDQEALLGMFSFIKNAFPAYYDTLAFYLPEGISLDFAAGENNDVECKRNLGGMVRVVNVEKVLSLCKCRGEGTLRIGIRDDVIPENDGTWKLTFLEGCKNQAERTEEPADIKMPVSEFSALITGTRRTEDIIWMPDTEVNVGEEALSKVFYQKKCFMAELF